jgi:hypothetical protein
MLFTSNKMAIAGMAFVAASMAAVVALITDVIFNAVAAAIVAVVVGGWFLWFWYGLPLSRRMRGETDRSR